MGEFLFFLQFQWQIPWFFKGAGTGAKGPGKGWRLCSGCSKEGKHNPRLRKTLPRSVYSADTARPCSARRRGGGCSRKGNAESALFVLFLFLGNISFACVAFASHVPVSIPRVPPGRSRGRPKAAPKMKASPILLRLRRAGPAAAGGAAEEGSGGCRTGPGGAAEEGPGGCRGGAVPGDTAPGGRGGTGRGERPGTR